jgi:hypothetical protein
LSLLSSSGLLVGFLLLMLAAFTRSHQQASGLLYVNDKLKFVGQFTS